MNRDVYVDSAVSDYREFRPSLPLASHLLCLWTQSIIGSHGAYAHRVLPDGCIDVVLINEEPPVVVGPWTESFVARLCPGAMVVGAPFGSINHDPARCVTPLLSLAVQERAVV